MAQLDLANLVPKGDPARHLTRLELQARLAALAAAPRDHGRVALIVCRCADGERETPGRVRVRPGSGVPGDKWGRRAKPNPESQLTVMCHPVAKMIANGQDLTVFGDNLFVDLDIGADNLPAGSRLRVGTAVVEVTPLPHNGCVKFRARFGAEALKFVNALPTRNRNLRGVHWKVIDAGEIYAGAPIEVLSRPNARELLAS